MANVNQKTSAQHALLISILEKMTFKVDIKNTLEDSNSKFYFTCAHGIPITHSNRADYRF